MRRSSLGGKVSRPQISDWWWRGSEGLQSYLGTVVGEGGPRRWGIENKAFNELMQSYQLERGYHHEPGALLAQMLILMLGLLLLTAYATLHTQQLRLGQVTREEAAHDLDLALEPDWRRELWFASG